MTHIAALIPSGLVATLRLDLLLKLGLAVLLGGVVGLERELSGKPAGLRTNILICIGATILADLSIHIGAGANGLRLGDPGRIAAQVIVGVGFLGAGTILQARGSVVGLTTAATIWVVAAIGLLIGAGEFVDGVGTTVLVVLVLAGLGKVERRILSRHRTVTAIVRVHRGTPWEVIDKDIRGTGVAIVKHTSFDHEADTTFEVRLEGPASQFDVLVARLLERADVLSVQLD